METFTIPYYYRFNIEFEVKAESKEDALKKIESHCGAYLTDTAIHSTLPKSDINRDYFPKPDDEGENIYPNPSSKLNADMIQLANDLSESHIDCYKERFFGKDKEDTWHDIYITHDTVLERESFDEQFPNADDETLSDFIDYFNDKTFYDLKK